MLTNSEILEAVAAERKPTFISTGISGHEDIDAAVEVFQEEDWPFVLIHCVSEYPAYDEILNLRSIQQLNRHYGCPVGYGGHETTMTPGDVAAMIGALAIERHITLDRAMYGGDQAASLAGRGLEPLRGHIRSSPVAEIGGVMRVTPFRTCQREQSQPLVTIST